MYCNNNNKMIAAFVLFSLMLLLLDSVVPTPTNEYFRSYLVECAGICKSKKIKKKEKDQCTPQLTRTVMSENMNCKCECEWENGLLGIGGSCVPSRDFEHKLAKKFPDDY